MRKDLNIDIIEINDVYRKYKLLAASILEDASEKEKYAVFKDFLLISVLMDLSNLISQNMQTH